MKRGAQIYPNDLHMLINLANIYLFNNDYESAITIYKAHLKETIDPGNSWENQMQDDYAWFKENNYDMVFKNTVSIIDKNGNKYRVSKEEFDNNPDLYGQTKNKFVAIDKNGIKHHIYNTDERYLSGELQAESKGRKWSDKAKMNIKDRKCRRWIFNPTSTECKFINSSETLDYIENGWQYGRVINKITN